MDLKTCRWMTRLLYVGCLALAIIALPLDNQILRMGLLGAAATIRMGWSLTINERVFAILAGWQLSAAAASSTVALDPSNSMMRFVMPN